MVLVVPRIVRVAQYFGKRDDTAIKVTDGTVEVVSEGHWKLFTTSPEASEPGS